MLRRASLPVHTCALRLPPLPRRCALLGDNIAAMAHQNGWSGIIINGCIRDSEVGWRLYVGCSVICC